MSIRDLKDKIETYYSKHSNLQQAVKEKAQALNTAKTLYNAAVNQGNTDNIGQLLSDITTAENDLKGAEAAFKVFSNIKPLTREDIIAAWENDYNTVMAPLEEKELQVESKKQEYIQAINEYKEVGEAIEAQRREYISLFSHVSHEANKYVPPDDSVIKSVSDFRNKIEHDYKQINM